MTYSLSNGNLTRKAVLIILTLFLLIAADELSLFADDNNSAETVNQIDSWRRDDRDAIPVTRWMDAEGRRPITYEEWRARTGEPGPFENNFVTGRIPAKDVRDIGLFCILVNTALYGSISTSLDQYMTDLIGDGFTVELHTMSGGTPESMRAFLQGKYAEGMVGAVLIGDLPVPWYEAYCWDPVEHEEFPCDLYYMDMDGIWDDIDADGLFDDHFGDVTPEVWVGRLTASPLTYGGAGEASLLENYFYKNHLYRIGSMVLNNRGLAFVDDDWEYYAGSWGGDLGMVHSDMTIVSDPYETTAPNYASQLPQNYESILLCAHSSPNTHWFKTPSETWTTIDYDEIVNIDPVAIFYNLFACSNARYVETNYMSGWYIFCQTYGLASVGSTKTGSMLDFGAFYGPFSLGKTIGEAFADWFSAVGSDGYDQDEICWHYGMTLCGDPTLRHREPNNPLIITQTLPDGDYEEAYLATLAAENGTPPYSWQIIDGELPKDLTLDAVSGVISGTINEVGTYAFSAVVTDAAEPPLADTGAFQISVNYICGDANWDGIVNVADAVYIINYVFKGGPPPHLLEAGDANCDGDNNIADGVYVINHVFKGGPAPCCP